MLAAGTVIAAIGGIASAAYLLNDVGEDKQSFWGVPETASVCVLGLGVFLIVLALWTSASRR
jgi:hypothetical protein